MRKGRAICVALLGVAGAVLAVVLMLHDYVRADVLGGPLPSPPLPREIIQLTPVEKLGKLMLYDSTLSGASGKEIAFDLRKDPPSGYIPLFPPPEVLENVQNVTGVTPAQAT